jgi:signal transduction histidine kinase
VTTDPVVLPLLGLADVYAGSAAIVHNAASLSMVVEVLLAAVLGFVPLIWRHRSPMVVFAVVWVHAVTVWFLLPGYRPTTALIVGLYAVAVDRPRRLSLMVLAAAIARAGLSGVDSVRIEPDRHARPGEFVVTVLMFAIFYGTAWAVGTVVRDHRGRLASLEEERVRARDEALAAERQRIAAELHDVVSHAVTLMVLQAAGAARLTDTEPERVHQALLHIQQAGQQAMAELRRLLDVLQASGRTGPPSTDPVPGLRDLPALIETVRRAGLPVHLTETGRPLPLDPSVELTAYRVVQECLTNTLKHAGPGTPIRIGLTWTDPVIVEVDDEGTGRPAATGLAMGHGLSTGHGLASLAERVRTVGGSLTSGPGPDGGFHVTATLPPSATTAT